MRRIAAMRKIRFFLLFLGLVVLLAVQVSPARAQAGSAYDMINAVNQFRKANGLGPLQISSALMAAAQGHSEYQASIGKVTHTGAGGTRAKDRAIAAGFGGGASVFISENIAGGIHLSVQTAIYFYWQDALHLSTMLNPEAQYIGAGVALAGDYVYYTVDVGYIPGQPGSNPTRTPGGPKPTAGPTAIALDPFIVSTPREDGAIVHVVGYGQTLIGIANTYDVPLAEIYALNGLNQDSVIYPGEWVYIRPPDALTATPSPTGKPTKTPRPSSTPTSLRGSPTATKRGTALPSPIPTATPTATPVPLSPDRQRLVGATVILSLLVLVGVIVSGLVKRE
jgi:hypothetical protein